MKRGNWVQVDTPRANVTSTQIDKLLEDMEYMFRVFAENSEGRSPALETMETITPRRAPGSFLFFYWARTNMSGELMSMASVGVSCVDKNFNILAIT